MPAWLLPALIAAGTAGGAALNNRSQRQNRETEEQLTREGLEQRETESLRDTASAESELDPFRHQLNQANALSKLDLLARMKIAPTRITAPARYAGAIPQRSGGLSYEMDPQVRDMAEVLKRDVASGRTAPTMTNAANYGKTGAVDLIAALQLAGRPASGTPAAPGLSYDGEVSDMLYRRRPVGARALMA
jgi:hypothetical protein